jgi:hypothetical protein
MCSILEKVCSVPILNPGKESKHTSTCEEDSTQIPNPGNEGEQKSTFEK